MEYRHLSELLQTAPRFRIFRSTSRISEARLRQGLHPPIPLWTSSPTAPVVIWGWQLIDRAAELGMEELPTLSIEGDAPRALAMALDLEDRPGEYSWRELAAIHALCEELGVQVDPELSRKITGDGGFVRKVRRFRALPDSLQEPLADGVIDLRSAEYCARHLPAPEAGVFSLLGSLSFSRRRQLLRLAVDILRREERDAASGDGVPGGRLRALLEEALAGDDPLEALSRLRYPELTRLQQRFDGIRRETLGGSGVELSPPRYFEGERFQVQFSFSGEEELARRIEALGRLRERSGELQDLL